MQLISQACVLEGTQVQSLKQLAAYTDYNLHDNKYHW